MSERDIKIANYLEEQSLLIMFSLNIRSRTDMENNPSLFNSYKKEMKKVFNANGVTKRYKVSKAVREILSDRNLHSINWVIQELRYGEGSF